MVKDVFKIADLMCISQETVDQNIKRLKPKLSVESRLDLIKLLTEWGKIKKPENKA
jgi:DNA-binding CsgD family transcriptional regulator